MNFKKQYFCLIFLTAAAIGFAWLTMLPSLNSLLSASGELSNQQSLLSGRQMNSVASGQAEAADRAEAVLSQMSDAYVQKDSELSIITGIEALAAKRQVSAKIVPDFNKQKKSDSRLPLTLTLGGQPDNIISLLADLNSLKYYLNPRQAMISKNSDKPGEITAVIEAVVYINNSSL